MGRPTDYSEEVAKTICMQLAEGKSLRSVCKAKGMPHESTVRLWALEDRDGFSTQYSRAREIGYHCMADETLEIADDGTGDAYLDDEGNERINQDVIARSRLRVDTRKWMLSKVLPKVYGDKLALTDPEGGNLKIETKDIGSRDLAKAVALVLQKGMKARGSGD